MSADPNAIRIRNRLTDPATLVSMLGLGEGAKRQSGGIMIRCPNHTEKTASCSVTVGPDGTVRVKCHGCQWSADALGLIGVARGLSTFADVLAEGASLAGLELEDTRNARPGMVNAQPRPVPDALPVAERPYPAPQELRAFWDALVAISSDDETGGMLQVRRGLDVALLSAMGAGRCIPEEGGPLPRWARFKGDSDRSRDWRETTHRLILPAFDAAGVMRSVRAWRVRSGGEYDSTPKRLPPSGLKATGLVLANRVAQQALAADKRIPLRWVFAEGEPDFLVWSCLAPRDAVIGIVSGGWTPEHAKRVAYGSLAVIRTHHDKAGDKYAAEIVSSLGGRVRVMRGGRDEAA